MNWTTTRPLLTRIAFALLWVFVFTLPLSQATEIPGVGMISKVAGLMAIAAGVVAGSRRRNVRHPGLVHMVMAGFILWSAVTLCWSIAPDLTVQRIIADLQLFALVLLIWELCVEEKDILQILSAFVLGTMIPALSTLKAFLPGQQTLYQRASVAGFDSDTLAFTLVISLPVAYYLILREKRAISALYRLQMGFAVCAILLTGSTATMFAMVIGLSLVCWTLLVWPVRTRTIAIALVMLLGAAAIAVVPPSVWQYISEEYSSGGITLTTLQSTPIGGFGAGSMASAVRQSPATAKPVLVMFSETGVVGVVSFLAILGVSLLSAERMWGANRSFWFTVLAVWIVGICALNWECSQSAWLLCGLLAAHSACLEQEAAVGGSRSGITSSAKAQKPGRIPGRAFAGRLKPTPQPVR